MPNEQPRAERTVRVFLSSTFRDMQAEREALIKRVFPRIARLCRDRHITFTEVDLRWGITDQQKQEGKVLSICLDEIDRCRPFFIGMLGERYGYVPAELPPGFVERFPKFATETDRSVTEMEIVHGVLDNPTMASRALFLLRHAEAVLHAPTDRTVLVEEPTAEEIAQFGAEEAEQRAGKRIERLTQLKERIRASGIPMLDGYRAVDEAAERVYQFLYAAIEEQFPTHLIPDVFTREYTAQEAVIHSRGATYFSDHRLEERLQTLDGPTLLIGRAGSGKTSFLAHWVLHQRAREIPEPLFGLRRWFGGLRQAPTFTLPVFVGASPESTNWQFVLRYLTNRLVHRIGLGVGEIPNEGPALIETFVTALAKAAATQRITIVIDGIDHLWAGDGSHSLFWLPQKLPANVCVVTSAAPGRVEEEAGSRGWRTITMPQLNTAQREAVIINKLAHYRKALEPDTVAEIVAAKGSQLPGFLEVLLNEIRLHGEHESLVPLIHLYLAARTIDNLLELMLERWESDYEEDHPGLVGTTLSLLWVSRGGLSEAELIDLLTNGPTSFPRILVSTFLYAAGGLIADRAGRLVLSDANLRKAVVARYLPDNDSKTRVHLVVARYFAERDHMIGRPLRPAGQSWEDDFRELGDLYVEANAWSELTALLADDFLLAFGWPPPDVRRYWRLIESNSSIRMTNTYRQAIDRPNDHGAARQVGTLFAYFGHNDAALTIYNGLIERYRLPKDQFMGAGKNVTFLVSSGGDLQMQTLAHLLSDRAPVFEQLNRLDESLADHAEAGSIFERLDDLRNAAYEKWLQAELALQLGRQEDAERLFRDAAEIAGTIGSADIMANATIGLAGMLVALKRFEPARLATESALQFCEPSGSSIGLGMLHQMMGAVLTKLDAAGEEVLREYEEAERHYRNLGAETPPKDLGQVLGAEAEVLENLNRPDQAAAKWRQAAKYMATSNEKLFERAALMRLWAYLRPQFNNSSSPGEYDRLLEEAEDVTTRILELADDVTPTEDFLTDTALVLIGRGERLRTMGQVKEAHGRLTRAAEIAGKHGLKEQEDRAKQLATELDLSESTLACVHCGRTGDPCLYERQHQFSVKSRGQVYHFAQCTACRGRLEEANTGYFTLKALIAQYPDVQKRRALAPGSDTPE